MAKTDTGKLFSSFVLCETTCKQLKSLPPKKRLKFYDALIEFGLNGVEPDFEGIEAAVWIPMADFIISSKLEDKQWHEKQSANGKRGGAPAGNRNAHKPLEKTTQNNPAKQPVVLNNPPKQPVVLETTQTTHNGKGNDNDNGNDNGNEKEKGKSADAHEKPPFLRPKVFEETFRNLIPPETEPGRKPPTPVAPTPPEPDESPPAQNFASWYEDIRRAWNVLVHDPIADTTALNLNDFERRDAMAVWKTYPQSKTVCKSIANYIQVKDCPEKYDPHGSVYDSLSGFLKKGIEKYRDESQPLERYISPAYKKQQEEEERKRKDNERTLAMIRKAREKQDGAA